MRRTGQSVCGHPHAAAVFSNRSRNVILRPHLLYRHVGGRGRDRWILTGPNLPVHPAPEQLAVLPLVLDEGTESPLLVCPHVHQRFVMFLVESRERLDDIRKWRSRWWGHDGSGVPASFLGFGTSVAKFVGRKEADRVGSWRLRYFYLRQINSHRCALCVTRKHQLSRSSPRSLSAFVPTVSLWQLVRPSLHSVSLSELPFHGGFYPVSTPITAIRHRWSSFCTWPTYLLLSPESFSRCRLRWTTPPSPHIY